MSSIPVGLTTRLPHIPDLTQQERLDWQRHLVDSLGGERVFQDELKSGGEGPQMVIIPAGSFEMGASDEEFGHYPEESPRHYVTLSNAFALGRYVITADEFERFRAATEWYLRDDLLWAKDDHPVMNISYFDAKNFCQWLSEESGEHYRLPTEAEWEYACRAGELAPFNLGDDVSCKEVHFNAAFPYKELREKKRFFFPRCMPMPSAVPVGSKPANLWGLHEMHGNVWEITQNPWTKSHIHAHRDGSINSNHNSKWIVTKGGSWFDPATLARSAARRPRLRHEIDVNMGFRVLREL